MASRTAAGAISLSLVYRIAHVATRRRADDAFSRISPRIVTSRPCRNEERSATLLSRCSPLCCPASLRRILPQRFRSECRLDARRRRFVHGNDAMICISRRFQRTKPDYFSSLRPRHARRLQRRKTSLHDSYYIAPRNNATRNLFESSRCHVSHPCATDIFLI